MKMFLLVALGALAFQVAANASQPERLPLQERYLGVLESLADQLVSTQITDPNDPDFGALVSPSTNPQPNPRHSRAAEAVYPLVVMYKHSGEERYSNAAILLGNWLVGLQQDDGAWGENWPGHDGWNGTTADQLISLAGALELLGSKIDGGDRQAWDKAISRAADFSMGRFPGTSNINYTPTAAVGLVLAHRAVASPKDEWLEKAESLIAHVIAQVNEDNLITGEGKGVDLGYNIAQTIGFIAWYGILADSPETVDTAASLLKTHGHFMYPNGAIDNSWGTRSFKWTMESGTKTAPGVHFTFGLLADRDPVLHRGAHLALDWLEYHALDAKNRVTYGPHAYLHANSNPPSNYGTFARAQSIATAIEFGPEATELAPIPAERHDWVRFFPTTQTAVLRTGKVMATVSSYENNGRYPLETAVRGGSATVVWFEGYGPNGFLQVSSQTEYRRIEDKHMPGGIDPLPLTPRIETTGESFHVNLFDPGADLEVKGSPTDIEVVTSGALRNKDGDAGTSFTWAHTYFSDRYSKKVEVGSAAAVRIVEPFVDNPGNHYALEGDDTFVITAADGRQWQLKVESGDMAYTLNHGEQRERYYHPFPGINGYPLAIEFEGTGPATITYTVSARPATVAGSVLDNRGQPLAGCGVLLGDASGLTTADGAFGIGPGGVGFEPGDRLRIDCPGYAPKFIGLDGPEAALGEITLQRPNFILLLSDDQGWVQTSTRMDPDDPRTKSDYFKTPNIDSFLSSGMTFVRGYSPGTYCLPTRRAIQVSQSPLKHAFHRRPAEQWTEPFKDLATIPRVLKAADPDYRAAHFGKWDHRFDHPDPSTLGYDESDGPTTNREGNTGAYVDGKLDKFTARVAEDPKNIFDLTRRGSEFMEKQVEAGNPFYLQLSHYALHLSIFYRQDSYDEVTGWPKGEKHYIPSFAAMLGDMDEGFGLLFDKIRELGIEDNTYIIYMGDNGGRPTLRLSDGESRTLRNFPLSEGKHSIYEGGIRVPFGITGPGIEPGSYTRTVVSGVDILPTLADIVDSDLELVNVDGGSIKNLVYGQSDAVTRPHPFLVFHDKSANPKSSGRNADSETALLQGDYKLIKTWRDGAEHTAELYNIAEDPGEANDLADDIPELAARLGKLMDDYIAQSGGDVTITTD